MTARLRTLFALLAFAFALVTIAAPASADVTPALVLAGGHMESDAIYRRIVDLAGGPGEARIAIVTAASEDAKGNGAFYVDEFRRRGAHAVWIPIDASHPEAAFSPEVV